MSFFAVLFALLLEQIKPLPRANAFYDALTGWMGWTARNFDAGREAHAWVVWSITVVVPALLAWAIYAGLAIASPLLGLGFDVAVLYLTLGFRQFSHYFTDIRAALEQGDEDEARRLLAEWRHLDASELPRSEIVRLVVEHSLLAAHRHVFGVFFWFVLCSTFGLGPAGAVLYRLAELASRYWAYRGGRGGVTVNDRLTGLALRLFQLLDHVPARLTASGFAVVGNFEEAVNCWRRDSGLWKHDNEGVILAAAAGAVGIRLGGGSAPGLTPDRAKTFAAGTLADSAAAEGSTPGAVVELGHLRSVVALVWRSVVLWMLLLALLSLANLIG
ncbi:MAG: CobD/CbiB family protein [Pseudomonadota bacterium]|nr:CobD/CbiB family protein [Pseudomonadota bacterium]